MDTVYDTVQPRAGEASVQRIVSLLDHVARSPMDARVKWATSYIGGQRSPTRLARDSGIAVGTSRKWIEHLESVVPSDSPLTPEEKRALLAVQARDDTAPANVRLSSIDLDNKMAGDYAPQQIQQVTVHMVMGDGGRPALEGQLMERLARLGLDLPGLPGMGKAPALLPGPGKGGK